MKGASEKDVMNRGRGDERTKQVMGVICSRVANRHTLMVNVPLLEIWGIVCQCLRQTGMSSHCGPWLSSLLGAEIWTGGCKKKKLWVQPCSSFTSGISRATQRMVLTGIRTREKHSWQLLFDRDSSVCSCIASYETHTVLVSVCVGQQTRCFLLICFFFC